MKQRLAWNSGEQRVSKNPEWSAHAACHSFKPNAVSSHPPVLCKHCGEFYYENSPGFSFSFFQAVASRPTIMSCGLASPTRTSLAVSRRSTAVPAAAVSAETPPTTAASTTKARHTSTTIAAALAVAATRADLERLRHPSAAALSTPIGSRLARRADSTGTISTVAPATATKEWASLPRSCGVIVWSRMRREPGRRRRWMSINERRRRRRRRAWRMPWVSPSGCIGRGSWLTVWLWRRTVWKWRHISSCWLCDLRRLKNCFWRERPRRRTSRGWSLTEILMETLWRCWEDFW